MPTTTDETHDAAERFAGQQTDTRNNQSDDNQAYDTATDGFNDVIAAVEQQLQAQRMPTATYRVQLNNRCSFAEIEAIVPYLYALGISDLYASPFLEARPGSPHGYDIVNHSAINSEIGSIEDLRSLRSALREHDMGLLADVVPNHMSATPGLNLWWQDVLENGPSSQFATHFDIDWMPLKPDLADKVLLPVLGDQFGKVLEDGQLSIHYAEGAFRLEYFDKQFPLAPQSYAIVLSQRLDEFQKTLTPEHEGLSELLSILTAIRNLPSQTESDHGRILERRREKEVIKRRLHDLVQSSPEIRAFVDENIRRVNGVPGNISSFDLLDELLQRQAYRLAYWRVASDEINYRRFFDINDLAAICTEHPQVFADSHRLLLGLLDEGTITGLRIDHPDGLYDPLGYLQQLQEHQFLRFSLESQMRLKATTASEADAATATAAESAWQSRKDRLRELWRSATRINGSPLARPLYVVVEKILAHGESLPIDWPVQGTVGYEYLNALNGLFVDVRGERPLSTLYSRFTGDTLDFEELACQCKNLIVRMSMASELTVLGHQLDRISERNRRTRDFTLASLTRALREVIAGFKVYRTYLTPGHLLERDRILIEQAITWAKRRNPAMDASIFDFVGDVLLLRSHLHSDDNERQAIERFVGKFQQLTGPVMAKAVEDTAFYRFNRLVSLNEVGGEPARFGTSIDEFHRLNQSRLPRQSHGLNATSTHDTKRSEDVRARISVLSEIPKVWREHVQRWSRWNRKLKTEIDGKEAPSRNAEYLLYQTLVGTWPGSLDRQSDRATYIGRMQEYMVKVVREAKQDTSWVSPNDRYEQALSDFVSGILSADRKLPFDSDLAGFSRTVAEHGRWNSLSQLILKNCSPGVPDFYQGTELWNLTLVDPDNRHPIDFAATREILDQLLDDMSAALGLADRNQAVETWLNPLADTDPAIAPRVSGLLDRLLRQRENGRIKLFMTLLTLRVRRRSPQLLTGGVYEPLEVTGPFADQLVAFARREGEQQIVVIAPRLTVTVTGLGGPPPIGDSWQETAVLFPNAKTSDRLHNIFTRSSTPFTAASASGHFSISVSDLLREFPVAVLIST